MGGGGRKDNRKEGTDERKGGETGREEVIK